jgi:hypothetical protein
MEKSYDFSVNLSNPIFKLIGRIADKQADEVFVIGGWVRDLFLDRESKDIDFAVHGSGINLAKEVAQAIKGSKFSFFKIAQKRFTCVVGNFISCFSKIFAKTDFLSIAMIRAIA